MRWHQLLNEFQNPLANPSFKAWFGDSKVVDKHGNPLVVFHGTKDDFDTFARAPWGASGASEGPIGFWFTENPQAASDFAEWASRNYDPSIVMPVYLKIQHPWIIHKYAEIQQLVDRHTKFSQPPHRMVGDKTDYKAARQELIDQGYDGIILPNTLTDSPDGKTPITQFVALYSNQMKSAVGNKGSYDDSNPNIVESMKAYHGSNHHFQEFSAEHVGTGKGYQTFGWGIYLTSERKIANRYKDKDGRVYVVDMPDVHELLDWNIPFGKQSSIVKNALMKLKYPDIRQEMIDQEQVSGYTDSYENDTGEDINGIITTSLLDKFEPYQEVKKQASMMMLKAGIAGIKYHDVESGYATFDNYVIFDPRRIQIKEKRKQRRKGRDGLIVKNVLDSGEGDMDDSKATTIVAFNPNQIKSVFSKEFKPSDDISENMISEDVVQNKYAYHGTTLKNANKIIRVGFRP